MNGIIPSNFFQGCIYKDSFMHGKCYDRPHNYPKLENKQVLNLPPLPHKRFNKIYDRTHYRNDMQFGNGSTWNTFPTVKLTKFGWICDFISTAYGDCGNSTSLRLTNSTASIEAIVKTNEINSERLFVSRQGVVLPFYQKGYQLGQTENKLIFYVFDDSNNQFTVTSDFTFELGEWMDVAGVHDKQNVKVYWNGNEKIGAAYTGNISYKEGISLNIARSTGGGGEFEGEICNIMINLIAPSASKIKDNYWRYN